MAGKKIAVSGTWKETSSDVEADVRKAVRSLVDAGDDLVVGGALGVDYYAISEMLALDPSVSRLTVILPTTLAHYGERVSAWAAKEQSEEAKKRVAALLETLQKLKATRSAALEEDGDVPAAEITETDYLSCNDRIVELSDELMAFQVNGSNGTQNAIDKMRAAGKPVSVRTYIL